MIETKRFHTAAILAWIVAIAAVLAVPAPAVAAGLVHAPEVGILHGTSTNWSGYSSTSGPFTTVSASWVQPAGTCTSEATYSAFWVGLDGDGSNTVEQTGSEVDCSGGSPVYYAWYEMYPKNSVNYSNPVQPGDVFTASVTASGTNFTLTISDATQGWTQTQHKTLASAEKHSAEVIAEAPCCTANGGILPLTDFGTVNFKSAEANGSALGNSSPQKIKMETTAGVIKAKPSKLSDGERFSVVWHHN
jgi:hypothetical protein